MSANPARKKSSATTGSELSPDEISGQLSQRVRELRKERGWSLDSLSAACGVSRSMLSQIERGEANPTLAVTVRISQAFGIALGELVEAPVSTSAIEVIRAEDRTFHYRSDDECRIRTLSPLHLEKDVEFYEVQLHANGKLQSAPHFRGTREFLTVEKGKVQVNSGEDTTQLGPGDSASYRVDVPHAIMNIGRGEAVLFLVVIYQN
ncbi:helix-turn-helix domain-containing protein [Gimesia maris]|jgi:transcriptional regulator with XRE-family HTH domain|uniref:XRE family transcriptional regulator n=1 Tax=Gimesia maris TaxID=122 RepID=A0A3D3R9B0_9PLAN|nr:XRE family transcriptional regulator [Gimesia maris]MAC55815.1 DNA-binding protein [Gimesia sp.]QDT81270.1 HTH-type transcriptional regulator SinR [Gimesia maris]HCO25441.1 XRE family transcriptional regulator [Gimesia maris]|tara:strand:+ start:56344 stop:56961 length:618 start_codon:yes stop_codon:yes gene_type:complete